MRHFAWIAALLAAATATAAAPGAAELSWRLLGSDAPHVMWTGETTRGTLVIRNTGTVPWSEDSHDHVSYHWLGLSGRMLVRDGLRTSYPYTVPPGGKVTVDVRIEVPSRPGLYVLQWDLVRERVKWLGAPDNGAGVKTVVAVLPMASVLPLAFLALTGAAVAFGRGRFATTVAVPPLWTWAGAFVVGLAITEGTGYTVSRVAAVLTASAAAMPALMVAVLPLRWRRWAAPATLLAVTFVGLSDILYFRFFGSLVTPVAFGAAHQTGQVERSVLSLLHGDDMWLALVPVAAVLFAALFRTATPGRMPERRTRLVVAAAVAAAVGLAVSPVLGSTATALADPTVSGKVFSYDHYMRQWGGPAVQVFETVRTFKEWLQQGDVDPATLASVRHYFEHRADEASAVGHPLAGAAAGANLILIQMESVQQWIIGVEVNGREVTPFLNRFQEQGLYFPNVFDQTDEGRTSDGEFTVLNSQHPLRHGAVAFRRAGNTFNALPRILAEHGYATLSAHAFERGFWNRAVLHPRYGFQRSMFKRELGDGEQLGWGLADEVFLQRMVPAMDALPRPFFAFLITLGLHHPFEGFPDRHKELDVGDLAGTPLGNYVHNMHYLDASLRELFSTLDRAGLLQTSVIALYGDHDSGLDAPPEVLRLAGLPRRDATTIQRIDRVPFFLRLPGSPATGRRDIDGGQIDIAPTLLDALGVPRPENFLGVSLLADRRPVPVVRHQGTATLGHVMWVPDLGADGGCVAYPDGARRPDADCDDLAAKAVEELRMSRLVVLDDLVPELLAPAPAR